MQASHRVEKWCAQYGRMRAGQQVVRTRCFVDRRYCASHFSPQWLVNLQPIPLWRLVYKHF